MFGNKWNSSEFPINGIQAVFHEIKGNSGIILIPFQNTKKIIKKRFFKKRNFFFGGVQESNILILDPGLDYKGLRYIYR